MDFCNFLRNMKLDEVVAWYQKKIGTYDKQQWEKTVEQKILNSFTSITLKNAKLKTEFIDVDLVRGSSFPKAKPKQSLLTVIRLAILRYLFLPIYAKWWVGHTSFKLYFIFLLVYIGQMLNWAIYMNNLHKFDENTEHIVSISELIIPMILSFILCLIHSLIVATNSVNTSNSKNKHNFFNKNGKQREKICRRKKIVRNIVQIETTTDNSGTIGSSGLLNKNKKISDIIVNINSSSKESSSSIIKKLDVISTKTSTSNTKNNISTISNSNNINNKGIIDDNHENDDEENFKILFNNKQKHLQQQEQIVHYTSKSQNINQKLIKNDNDELMMVQPKQDSSLLKSNVKLEEIHDSSDIQNKKNNSNNSSSNMTTIIKKRNVNWDSPIHNYANDKCDFYDNFNLDCMTATRTDTEISFMKSSQSTPNINYGIIIPITSSSSSSSNSSNSDNQNRRKDKRNLSGEKLISCKTPSSVKSTIKAAITTQQDHSSDIGNHQSTMISKKDSNMSTSSSNNSTSSIHNRNDKNCNSNNTSSSSSSSTNTSTNSSSGSTTTISDNMNIENIQLLEAPNEDDGFESLNGKSSSGEENRIIENDKKLSENSNNDNEMKIIYDKIELISSKAKSITSSIKTINNNNNGGEKSNQLRQRITFGKNRTNYDLHHKMRNDNGDNDDELSDEEIFKKKFDKLNKRYSIPMIRNSRKKYPCTANVNDTTESELNNSRNIMNLSKMICSKSDTFVKKKSSSPPGRSNESSDIDEDGDDEETATSPTSLGCTTSGFNGCSTSATEWLGITTNSEECSYSSEPNSDLKEDSDEISERESAPNVLLNSHGSNDIISCTVWDRNDPKKAEMSVLDISSCIIEKVEAMPESSDYIYIGVVFSIILSLIPSFCRLCEATVNWETATEISYLDVPILLWEKTSFSLSALIELSFGKSNWERTVLFLGYSQRLLLTFLLFFLFAVAERTFKQRFLYAKLFSHLTSSRRARKSDLPHFRLNKVRNIKTWLSVRSYLKRRGPQRSVDVIVSTALSITLLLLGFLSVECLKDSVHIHSQLNLEALFWSGALGIYLLRFMTLGNKINRKYRSISVLITEQINLYLQIEQKPKKKDELMVANSVLKLAADLLKELESPFKISGLSANPYLFTTIKVVILSAFSGVLSELLGFKLKLHKIKIK